MVAMGFIAFSIGNEFRLSQLKKTGKQAMFIGVLQALAALAFVDIALVIFHFLAPRCAVRPCGHHARCDRHSHRACDDADGRAPVQGQG